MTRDLQPSSMSATDVQSLVRSVIIVFALPFAVVSVTGAPAGWKVVVRSGTGDILRFTVADGERDDMRLTIRNVLQAER
jgi:hypothetical protein